MHSHQSDVSQLVISTDTSLEATPANEPGLLDVARLLILLQRPTEAATLLEKVSVSAQTGGRMHIVVCTGIIQIKALAAQGKLPSAVSRLLEILPLAAPEGYISSFVDEGETLRQLLHEARAKAPAELRIYIEQVLAAFSPGENQPTKRETGHGVELSDREREILSLVAEGLSNQDIADRLVISITTVKTHVGNIFNKLGVTSRIQAIARAEGLGLLPRR